MEKSQLGVVAALADFSSYLMNHIGEPINLQTVAAFSTMFNKIIIALIEK